MLGEKESIRLVTLSRPYVSEPVGMESENLFVNGVGILETSHDPEALLTVLQQVEKSFGRTRKTGTGGYEDRLLDLDILYYDDCVLSTGKLLLPHPHLAQRLFVLAPLAEIDPLHCDPCTGKSAEEMYQELLQQMDMGKEVLQEIRAACWA